MALAVNMGNIDFNDFYWHDAIIERIIIDRNNPGIKDAICFEMVFLDEGKVKFFFKEVYWANLSLNFAVVAPESVLNTFLGPKGDSDLTKLYSQWKGDIDHIKLDCFIINLNSTGGQIKIIAKSFNIAK